MKNPNWTDIEDQILKENYLKENGFEIITKLLPNRNYNAIKARARLFNLRRVIPYTKNEKFFEEPNVLNSAIVGLIAADGCVESKKPQAGPRITLGLKQDDAYILEQIKELTNYTGRVRYEKEKIIYIKDYRNSNKPPRKTCVKMVTLGFQYAEKWVNDLFRHWNITPRKSLTLAAPHISELDQILAYYSGTVCGDGTIYTNSNILTINLLGTEALLSFFKSVFDKIVPTGNSQVRRERKNSKIFSYRISGVKAYLIAKMILCLDIPRLERKWSIARKHINQIEQNPQHHTFIKYLKEGLSNDVITFLNRYGQKVTIPQQKPASEKVLKALEEARKLNPKIIKHNLKLKTISQQPSNRVMPSDN